MLISPDQDGLSLEQLTSLSEAGNVVAQFYLGMSYHLGLNTEKDPEKAVHWWTCAAEQNNREAQYLLGQSHYFGNAVEQDAAAAASWFRKAAELGHVQAQLNLAAMLLSGTGIDKDDAAAAFCLRHAAEAGSAEAAVSLGRLHEEGQGVPQSYQEARGWFLKALELDPENGDAAYSVGLLAREGRLEDIDPEDGLGYLDRAAGKGHILAQFELGSHFLKADGTDGPDYAAAARWFEAAARQGHPGAHLQLGLLCGEGLGVEHDGERMLRHLTAAAEKGLADALFALGMAYAQGKGVERDPMRAAGWFARLAEQGNPDGRYMLGAIHERELEDPEAASRHYARAAEGGHPAAQYALARLHHTVDGPLRDVGKARDWYEACLAGDGDDALKENAARGLELLAESGSEGAAPGV